MTDLTITRAYGAVIVAVEEGLDTSVDVDAVTLGNEVSDLDGGIRGDRESLEFRLVVGEEYRLLDRCFQVRVSGKDTHAVVCWVDDGDGDVSLGVLCELCSCLLGDGAVEALDWKGTHCQQDRFKSMGWVNNKRSQGFEQWKISTLTIKARVRHNISVLAEMLGSFDAYGQGLWRLTSDMSTCTDSNNSDNKVHTDILDDFAVVSTHDRERGRQI